MRYRTFLTFSVILIWFNGLIYLLLPELSLRILGQTTNAIGLTNTRVSGAIAIGMGIYTWMGRQAREREIQRLIAWGNVFIFGLLVPVELHGLLSGALNQLGWFMLAADIIFAVGFFLMLLKNYTGVSS